MQTLGTSLKAGIGFSHAHRSAGFVSSLSRAASSCARQTGSPWRPEGGISKPSAGPKFSGVPRAAAAFDAPLNGSSTQAQQLPPLRERVVKVASLGLLFFCSTFNYTILQNLKDFLIVTQVGAEALPFLEAYGVLPVSLAFFILYNKLNETLPEKWVYQAALTPFLAFYALFATVLYPLAGTLHPTHLLEGMRAALPAGFVGLASVLVNWSYSLFFVMGELWGGVAISLLFWGLADEVCNMREAESVYPLLGIIANVGLVLAGSWIKAVNAHAALLSGWGVQPVQALIATILAVSVALVALKSFVYERFVPPGAHTTAPVAVKSKTKGKKEKKKSGKSLAESLTIFKTNPKVGNLAVLVIAYFISQKLFDISWKAQLKVMYPTPEACQTVLADVAQWTGIATICLMATSKWVFRHGGWATAALATPLLVLISGGVFFASAIVAQGGTTFVSPQIVAWLMAAGGMAGIVGRVASKAPKYSLFDPAKEMVYITMSKEEKNEGKAAVDLLGSYFGKSGASWIMQVLVLGLGSLAAALPIIALVHVVVGVAWTKATFSLAGVMQKVRMEESPQQQSSSPVSSAAGGPELSSGSTNGHSGATGTGTGVSLPPQQQELGQGHTAAGNGNGNGKGVGQALSSNEYNSVLHSRLVEQAAVMAHVSSTGHGNDNGHGSSEYLGRPIPVPVTASAGTGNVPTPVKAR